MKRNLFILALSLGLVALGGGCLDKKVIQLVLTGETYADFSENETSADQPDVVEVNFAQEIRDILDENGYSTDDIDSAFVTSVHYGVTDFSQAHDWVLGGEIRVRRTDVGPTTAVIVEYTDQSVQDALGEKITAELTPAGVDLINQALSDFLDGQNPVLEFEVQSSSIDPNTPTPTDPMIFDWRAWLAVQLVMHTAVEVPDPF